MPKRSRKKPSKRAARDANQVAYDLVQQIERLGATTKGKDPLAVALGRRGGLKGGRARADKLTKEQLRESAVRAARARWDIDHK